MITVLMATYNGETYLAQQIESLLGQTDTGWKLIVQDDCSADRTAEIAKAYAERYPDKIRVIQRERPSGSAKNNFFSMLPLVDTEYCMTCDQDDVWLPEKMRVTLEKMWELERECAHGTPLLVHTDLRVVDQDLNCIADSMFQRQNLDFCRNQFNHLLVQNIVTGCTMLVNRPLLERVEGAVPAQAIMHDWWLALVACAFGRIGFVDQAMILYRQHGKNTVGAKDDRSISFSLERLLRKNEMQQALQRTYLQAAAFAERYAGMLQPWQQELLSAYIGIPQKSYPARLATLQKYDFWKSGLARKAGQFLFV